MKVPFTNPKRSFYYKSQGHKIEEEIINASVKASPEIELAKEVDKEEAEKLVDKALDQYPERVAEQIE